MLPSRCWDAGVLSTTLLMVGLCTAQSSPSESEVVYDVKLHSLASHRFWPPWCGPPKDGKNFTIDLIDNVPDLHGDITDPQLVIFFGGNQFMVVPELLDAFRREHPQIQRIFVETLPPGVLADQIEQGALIVGNLRVALRPDIYAAGHERIERLQREKSWFSRRRDYARNRLAILVPRGNPAHISSLKELAGQNVRIAMPNPQWEGIGNKIIEAYTKAGGRELADAIMREKVKDGTTFLTHIHHRQTPLRILLGMSDAGPLWITEAKFQEKIGHPVEVVEIPDEDNVVGTSTVASLKNAPHPEAAEAFLDFLVSEKGQSVYRKYGFGPPPVGSSE